jgi:lipopolysaccharide export system protein LptA
LPRFLSILLLAAPALCAQVKAPDAKKNPISLLPDGSVLKGVLLPRYDAERNLVGDLKAETMTLIDSKRVQGEDVLIRFYNPDRSLRGKVNLQNALFDQEKSRLFADEPVEITTDRLVARGSGLVYAIEGGEGFLRGPATTWISAPPTATSMNTSPLKSAALVALCLVQAPLIAAPPAFVTEEEIAALKAEAASVKPEADKIKASTEANLAESITEGDKASDAALKFIKTSEIKAIAEDSPGKEPEAKPLEVKPGPDDTLITCEGGMYFDADEGVLVYLKNVKVTDPRFNLVAGGQLKVFFDKKPEKKKKPGDKEKKAEEQAGPANFGDVKKLVAEGAVVLDQKGVGGKDPVKASGSILTYDVPEGEIIIHGGYPWVKQGTYYARAMEPDLTLRLLNDGSFSTKGNWQMGGNMNLKGQ